MYTLAIILALLAIFGFGLLFGCEIYSFNKTGAKKYSFFRHFPYELNCFRKNSKYSWIYAISLVVACLLLIFPFFAFAFISGRELATRGGWTIAAGYILFGISIISAISFISICFTKLSNFKGHVISAVIFVISILCSYLMMLLYFGTDVFLRYEIRNEVRIVIFFICLIFIALLILLMFNPSFKNWAKLVKYEGDNYERPKFSYLCMLEWGAFLAFVLELVPLFLAMFF